MERAEWLKRMQSITEEMYDQFAPLYWDTFGLTEDDTHQKFLKMFLERVGPGAILSAACGAGRYDGILLEAGHSVVGTDQSEGMLRRAREHFPEERYPQLRYEKVSLQEMDFHEEFEGAICMDALEHVPPEDYPGILRKLQEALKPGGLLYFTADTTDTAVGDQVDLSVVYERAKELGLPVVFGEWVDELEEARALVKAIGTAAPDDQADKSVYHYFQALEQVRAWVEQAGLVIEEEGMGSGWYHILARKIKE